MKPDEDAYQKGKAFGKTHALEFCDTLTLFSECPTHLRNYFDVFKYGAQSAWRRKGELPGMIARDLEVGDVFRVVGQVDPESDRRVCRANDHKNGVRFGFPGRGGRRSFWCFMGPQCLVELVEEKK